MNTVNELSAPDRELEQTMGKGPTVDKGLRDTLRGVAPFYLNGTVPEFREAMSASIETAGFPLPGEDVFRKILSEVRGVINDQDQPWSFGALASPAQAQIPVDALPEIEETWKYCLSLNQKLTIRQAKWVGRLRALVPRFKSGDINTGKLYRLASLYAGREIAHMAEMAMPKNKSTVSPHPDTSDIDTQLVFTSDERHAAIQSGVVNEYLLLDQLRDLAKSSPPLAATMLHELELSELPLNEQIRQLNEQRELSFASKAALLAALPLDDPTGVEIENTFKRIVEAASVARFVIQGFGKYAKNWMRITPRRRLEIINKVVEESTAFHTGERPAFATLDDFYFRPSAEILKEVGYNLPHESEV